MSQWRRRRLLDEKNLYAYVKQKRTCVPIIFQETPTAFSPNIQNPQLTVNRYSARTLDGNKTTPQDQNHSSTSRRSLNATTTSSIASTSSSSSLQQNSKPPNHPPKQSNRPKSLPSTQRPNSHMRKPPTRGRSPRIPRSLSRQSIQSSRNPITRHNLSSIRRSRRTRSAHTNTSPSPRRRPRQRRSILPSRILRSTRMIRRTSTLTPRIPLSAIRNALRAPFLTDEEGESLTVLGDIWGEAVVADAGVG